MNKKCCIVLAAAMAAASFAMADEYQWLTFRFTDDSVVTVAAEGLEMNYEAGLLQLVSPTVSSSFPVETLLSMQFVSDPSAIAVPDADNSSRTEYFTVSGVKVGTYDSVNDARAALGSGIYIARSGDKCWKLIF